ncbi:penicillin-binding protein 2 [Paenibacillus sp. IB182496]|uniref:Penicillin-binding protein 2 n=1 Tax=Paenibacillus sabuli TaxID=2772509 RepID=A0A927GU14_9BACL|nr:penicillin-binding transpeptidase domain-containing protein [Paenibacillus sabuli]MBD2847876.1 penicillin-binding protein 2 [Paenibacillus sabuli]
MQLRTEEQRKREAAKRRNFSFRLNVFFFVAFFAFSVLIVRLAVLQFVEGPEMKEREASIGTRYVKIPPIRGNILAAGGEEIAYSTSMQSLYYTLAYDTSTEQAQQMAGRLAEALNANREPDAEALTEEQIFDIMDVKGRRSYVYEPRRIKADLSEREIAYFMERRDLYPGVEIVEESIRNYSEDTIAVQLIGYMRGFNSLNQGNNAIRYYVDIAEDNGNRDPADQYLDKELVGYDGIELMFQEELRGRNGLKTYPVDYMSRIVGPMELTLPEKGNNVYLTIDRDIQLDTEQAILDHLHTINTSSDPQEYAPYAKTGYAVAMEVKTGNVVAMASMPDYDPNVWKDGVSQEQYNYLMYFTNNGTIRSVPAYYEDVKEGYNHPSSLVPLGSTQKPLSVLLGLNEGLFTTTTMYNDIGFFEFGREGYETRVNNASNARNGLLDPSRAIAKSSNAFMSEMVGNKLYMMPGNEGLELWDRYNKEFGLGVPTGSGLPNESSGIINYFHEAESGSSQSALIYASFGQQGQYTALQLAQYATMLANRGQRIKPQLVKEIRTSDGELVRTYEREVLNEVDIPDEYWREIEIGMDQVPVRGFDDFPYDFRRKTGTSQQDVGNRKKVENAVFIAYAPADDPVLAVAVVVPDGGYGGRGAAPIARQIFDAYDAYVGLDGQPKGKQLSQDGEENGGTDN